MKFRSKRDVREHVWRNIEGFATFPFPVKGRIPNFVGAIKACEKLRELERYQNSTIVFSAPDSPLKRAREIVIEDGKALLAVKPHMKGFLLIRDTACTTISKMSRCPEVKLETLKTMGKIRTFIQGCVAVDRKGNRIGKGSGYGDKEYTLLKKHGLLADDCIYVVIAHPVQVFEDLSYLMDEHDIRADVILTPHSIVSADLKPRLELSS
jgi:5-formyltetrahydrofolate cyclo-ligase